MQLAKALTLLTFGVALGWWLHDIVPADTTQTIPVARGVAAIEQHQQSPPESSVVSNAPLSQGNLESAEPPSAAQFRLLLTEQQFEQALAYYEQALSQDEEYLVLLKPVLEKYLKECLERCRDGVFVNLADIWLGSYYQDIPVLLLLAEHQRLQGLPEGAASTLQLASTYAWQSRQQEAVNAALQHLVMTTDNALSGQENWIELLGFYEYLETIDLGNKEFLLREAVLYRLVGEENRSRDLLLELQAGDSKLSSEWTAALDSQLSMSTPQPKVDERPGQAIAVTPLGDHFIAQATLNRTTQVSLLIDTGASLTTLSQSSFSAISSNNFEYRGSHMFNTANGLAQGEVYRATSIRLGDIQLRDIDIAVLDYPAAPGVDGLLGMNILRHYRFEIDTEGSMLYLQPR